MSKIKFVIVSITAMLFYLDSLSQNTPYAGYFAPEDIGLNSTLTEMVLTPESESNLLPIEFDNSVLIFFPHDSLGPQMYNQYPTGSCQTASTVYYAFTFERNRLLNLSGDLPENIFAPNSIYNSFNNGQINYGYGFTTVFNALKSTGVMSAATWGNLVAEDYLRWPTGYNLWFSRNQNRINQNGIGYLSVQYSYDKILEMKHFLYDHNEGASSGSGGLMVFGCSYWGHPSDTLPSQSSHPGEHVKIDGSKIPNSGHALTIVGYCDDIKYDINEDGLFTTDIDINGDNIVDLRDREIGAVKVADSYGDIQGNQGFEWVLYRCLVENSYYFITPDVEYYPELMVKAEVNHSHRNDLQLGTAWAVAANLPPPAYHQTFELMYHQGGNNPILGAYLVGGNYVFDYDPIEFMIDRSSILQNPGNHLGKIFLFADNQSNTSQPGDVVNSVALVDYRWNEVFELESNMKNVPITDSWTYIPIEYDLIKLGPQGQDITQNTVFSSNRVSRFNPAVTNNAVLTVQEGVRIDMYNSNLTIDAGSTLVLQNNSIIVAKRGYNSITIYGDIQAGFNIQFIAENGAHLDILLNNPSGIVEINECVFNNVNIGSTSSSTYLSLCEIHNGMVSVSGGSLTVDECELSNSQLNAAFANNETNFVDILNSTFQNITDHYNAIEIESYSSFSVQNCTISNYGGSGIVLMNSGDNAISNRNITGNTISSNSIYEDWSAGVLVYNSYARIHDNNEIKYNAYGIQSLDNSHVSLKGDSLAHYSDQTQQIVNNSHNQVYASQGSFPYYFRWNTVMTTDNSCLVYYDKLLDGPTVDVRGNYWGPGFVADDDLCPQLSYYKYKPVWPLVYVPVGNGDNAEDLFELAQNKVENGDYQDAEAIYQEIVASYPESDYSTASLQELFSLEKATTKDYIGLKSYYEGLSGIESLNRLAAYLANDCNIELENWITAIDWLESVIEDPPSYPDSLFAIIDLENVYLKMQNSGLKSSYVGKYPCFRKENLSEFRKSRDYYLSILFDRDKEENRKKPVSANIDLSVSPNPASYSISFNYILIQDGLICIRIMDAFGREVLTVNGLPGVTGLNQSCIDLSGMPAGVYFCMLLVDGNQTSTTRFIKK